MHDGASARATTNLERYFQVVCIVQPFLLLLRRTHTPEQVAAAASKDDGLTFFYIDISSIKVGGTLAAWP